jgi:type II secretory pathway pseudopilin PulG
MPANIFTIRKNNKGKSFVTIMIVIAVAALSLRILAERLIKFNIAQNESIAQETLKLISAALENYAKNNRDRYPSSLALLTQPKPPYLDKNYVALSPVKGYVYACSRLEPAGYSCFATPLQCKIMGNAVFSVSTGGAFSAQPCGVKE